MSYYNETLLYSADAGTTSAIHLSEPATNFERLKFEVNLSGQVTTGFGSNIFEVTYGHGPIRLATTYGGDNGWYLDCTVVNFTDEQNATVKGSKAVVGWWNSTNPLSATRLYTTNNRKGITRIWGVNRV